ncbi:MAG: 3'-5' exonuclease [Algicola sp.]|nr:3'-5' exonuclease [Algicola sp.]
MLAKSKLMNWLKTCVVFDTETTGLGDDAQICEISIIDHAGSILLNTLVKPTCVIPDDVIAIHGITNEMVKDAPPWSKVAEKVQAIFMNRVVVAFNAKYDKRLLDQTSAICTPNLPRIYGDFYCAFEAYKVYRNEWNFDKNDYQRQSLINAAKQMGVEIQGKSHRALDDSQTTLEMMKAVAAA